MKFIFPFFPDPPKYSLNAERVLCPRTLVSHTPSLATFSACSTSNTICATSDLQRALPYLGQIYLFFLSMKIMQRPIGIKSSLHWIWSTTWFIENCYLYISQGVVYFLRIDVCNPAYCLSPGRIRLVACFSEYCVPCSMGMPKPPDIGVQASKGTHCYINCGSWRNKRPWVRIENADRVHIASPNKGPPPNYTFSVSPRRKVQGGMRFVFKIRKNCLAELYKSEWAALEGTDIPDTKGHRTRARDNDGWCCGNI